MSDLLLTVDFVLQGTCQTAVDCSFCIAGYMSDCCCLLFLYCRVHVGLLLTVVFVLQIRVRLTVVFVLQGICQTAVDCCLCIAGYVSDLLLTVVFVLQGTCQTYC